MRNHLKRNHLQLYTCCTDDCMQNEQVYLIITISTKIPSNIVKTYINRLSNFSTLSNAVWLY